MRGWSRKSRFPPSVRDAASMPITARHRPGFQRARSMAMWPPIEQPMKTGRSSASSRREALDELEEEREREPVRLAPPRDTVRWQRLPVVGQVPGDHAEALGDLRVLEQVAPLLAVGAGRVLEQERHALPALLEVDAVAQARDVEVQVAARSRGRSAASGARLAQDLDHAPQRAVVREQRLGIAAERHRMVERCAERVLVERRRHRREQLLPLVGRGARAPCRAGRARRRPLRRPRSGRSRSAARKRCAPTPRCSAPVQKRALRASSRSARERRARAASDPGNAIAAIVSRDLARRDYHGARTRRTAMNHPIISADGHIDLPVHARAPVARERARRAARAHAARRREAARTSLGVGEGQGARPGRRHGIRGPTVHSRRDPPLRSHGRARSVPRSGRGHHAHRHARAARARPGPRRRLGRGRVRNSRRGRARRRRRGLREHGAHLQRLARRVLRQGAGPLRGHRLSRARRSAARGRRGARAARSSAWPASSSA